MIVAIETEIPVNECWRAFFCMAVLLKDSSSYGLVSTGQLLCLLGGKYLLELVISIALGCRASLLSAQLLEAFGLGVSTASFDDLSEAGANLARQSSGWQYHLY